MTRWSRYLAALAAVCLAATALAQDGDGTTTGGLDLGSLLSTGGLVGVVLLVALVLGLFSLFNLFF